MINQYENPAQYGDQFSPQMPQTQMPQMQMPQGNWQGDFSQQMPQQNQAGFMPQGNQPPQQMQGGVPQYGGGQFAGPAGKGGQMPAQPQGQPQGGDWQDRFQQIIGQNWPTQQQNAQGKGGAPGEQPKATFGSNNSWS